MEISGKVLREVEFRDRLRGYDTDEVDEFLEKVAVAVDELHSELSRLASRSQSHVRPIDDPPLDDDSIRRTLVLAQRTADLAINEARQEAEQILADARKQSEALLTQANETARNMRDDAEQALHDRVDRLASERERLEREAGSLIALLDGERQRLTQGLGAALRFVEETLAVPSDLAQVVDWRAADRAAPGWEGSDPADSEGAAPGQAGSLDPAPEAPDPALGAASPPDWTEPGWPRPAEAPPASSEPTSLPDVEAEISEDAAEAARRIEPIAEASRVNLSQSTSPPPALDADDALWAEWASGGGHRPPSGPGAGGLGAFDEPLRFDPRPGGDRPA